MRLLYKYRKLSNASDIEQFQGILKTESFWFPKATDVNDPFELICSIQFDANHADTVDAFVQVEMRLNPTCTRAEAVEKVRLVLAGVSAERLNARQLELSLDVRRRLSDSVTMCCFSGVPDSVLLWSHYAAGHTGVAIEVHPIELSEFAYPVVYSDVVVPISPLTLIDGEAARRADVFDLLFLRKAACWSYEREFRIMRFGKDLRSGIPGHASAFRPGSIKRVIIGLAMSTPVRLELLQWMKREVPQIGIAYAMPSPQPNYSLQILDGPDAAA
jgi:hypothetical protein